MLRLRIRQEAKRRFVVARSRALRLCVAMLLWPRPLSVARTAVARIVRPVPAVLTLVTAMAVTRGLGRLRARSRGRHVLRRASDRIVADDGDAPDRLAVLLLVRDADGGAVVETSAGMLNAIGLQNVGVEAFIREKLPYLRQLEPPLIVNVAGESVEDFRELTKRIGDQEGVAGIEPGTSSPQELLSFMNAELSKWATHIRNAGITPE